MAYFVKLVKGETYNLQGIQLRNGDEKQVPEFIYNYVKNQPQFERRKADPQTLEDFDAEELKAYAAAHNIDIGRATSHEGILSKIKDAEKLDEKPEDDSKDEKPEDGEESKEDSK